MILNPRRFITEDEVVGALHGIGAPVTTLEVAQRLRARATLIGNRLSRLATYGKIARTRVTETSIDGTGLNRTYCLWSALPSPSHLPSQHGDAPQAAATAAAKRAQRVLGPGGPNTTRVSARAPSREGQTDREA